MPNESLEKELHSDRKMHISASISDVGLTLTKREFDEEAEIWLTTEFLTIPAQATRSLANLLRTSEARALIHYRKVR